MNVLAGSTIPLGVIGALVIEVDRVTRTTVLVTVDGDHLAATR